MKTTIIVLLSVFPVTFSTGCGIPVMVVAVPCVGSGAKVSFCDEDDAPLHADGLLLVARRKDWSPVLPGTQSSSTRVAEVRNGEARLPHEWVPASLWLQSRPGELAYFAGSMWAFLPALLVPIPAFVPSEEVRLIPLLPGYWPFAHDEHQSWMIRNERDWEGAETFWRKIRSEILHGCRSQSPLNSATGFGSWVGFAVRFPRQSDYERTMTLVERELKYIRAKLNEDDGGDAGSEEKTNVEDGARVTRCTGADGDYVQSLDPQLTP